MHVKTLCFLFFLTTLAAEPAPIYPPPIEKGDVIAIVLPASFLSYLDEEAAQDMLSSKLSWLESKGYEPILYPKKIKRIGYHSGTDEERAEALMDAWKDERVKAIWCFQGGHGSYKILDKLDYKYIQENPKIFIGMSDITALHIAIQQKTGFVTFLAPILKILTMSTLGSPLRNCLRIQLIKKSYFQKNLNKKCSTQTKSKGNSLEET
jgi:muramoyltetrapeptide carboxypeptidase